MDPCVYTTQHDTWLQASSACPATQLACFRSAKRWVTAKRLLDLNGALPVILRQQDEARPFVCRFVGDLIEIRFQKEFAHDEARLAWLDEHLELQRDTIKTQARTAAFPTWESQYQTSELDKFMKASTWYVLRNVREIAPIPLPRLRTVEGNHPLSPDYRYSYSLCFYPEEDIQLIAKPHTVA